jgi:precorrin-6Y C5,15-methyltransferase (decarboxylating)
MYDICLFSGTTEGRKLAEYLGKAGLQTLVCVATSYGENLTPKGDNLKVSTGRMDEAAMTALFQKERFSLIVDATHPHAQLVTDNIVNAARAAGLSYLRLVREETQTTGDIVYVDSIAQAAKHLQTICGNILVTTGSKELAPYTYIPEYQQRLFVRVLPIPEALESCKESGIPPQKIIAMQGPFSMEMNQAMLRDNNIRYLVTKESGDAGGLQEKLDAAKAEDVQVILIGRPPKVSGKSLQEAIEHIQERFQVRPRPVVHLIGMGMMGNLECLTGQALSALKLADCFIGAPRLIKAVQTQKPSFECIVPEKIYAFIKNNPCYQNPAVLFSGDIGFYSGAKKLLPLLKDFQVVLHPGISSLQALCAKVQTSWDDALVISLHGREADIAATVSHHSKVFALVGGANGVQALCHRLFEAGLGKVLLHVGQRLGYPDERISTGLAEDLKNEYFDTLSSVLIINPNARNAGCPHLPDEAFMREMGDKLIPMTKAEIRAVSLSKLQLPPDAIVYDIGAGTGSVSIELSKACPKGRVYAVEGKQDACALIQKNAQKHACYNLQVVEGWAPDACGDLPFPTHAFIGGSSGNMEAIVRMLISKNPSIRIVITLIALESISETLRCVKAMNFKQIEIIQLQVSKARQTGDYNLMTAQNPVMIVTCQHPEQQKEQINHATHD